MPRKELERQGRRKPEKPSGKKAGRSSEVAKTTLMEKWTKTTEIVIEKSELLVIRKTGTIIRAWCPACAAEVQMLTPEEAAHTTGYKPRSIYRRLETGQIHYLETAAGALLLCAQSLA